jgi:hypothetical protein
MKRSSYLDNLRIALTMVVIAHHTAIAYGASGGWFYITKDVITGYPQMALSGLLTINQAYFMSLFFFVSAYFMPASFDKKGFARYMSDRLVRLGIPLLVFSVLVLPTLNYLVRVHRGGSDIDYLDYLIVSNRDFPNTGHLWFLLSLLVFETAYGLYRKYAHRSFIKKFGDNPPSLKTLAVVAIGLGLLSFLLRTVYPIGGKNVIGLQFGYFGLYIAMYIGGIVAGRKKWLDYIPEKFANRIFAATAIIALSVYFAWYDLSVHPSAFASYIGGFNGRALLLACWEAIVCVGFCFSMPVLFREYVNKSTSLSRQLALASYAAYVFHPIFVAGNTILFEPISMAPLIKFPLVLVISIVECFAFSIALRQLAILKRVF